MAQLLSQVAVGSIVKLNESGSPVNYIVVNQGIPSNSNLYDASCNGTWLLRQDIQSNQVFGSNNAYGTSTINTWLNSTFLGLLDSDIQTAIKQVKIPYCAGNGSTIVNSGTNGLSCKVFLLSFYELYNGTGFNSPIDGGAINYFLDVASNPNAQPKRVANFNGNPTTWSLRTQYGVSSIFNHAVSAAGIMEYGASGGSYGIRPAFIMDGSTTYVQDDGTITLNQPPSAPGSITVPTVAAGQPCAITWTAATDTDGTIASYTLERSVNGSGWTQVFSGNALTYTDTIGSDWGTIQYRVCAVDNYGASGPYATSETQTVQDGILYISGPASAMGSKVAPFAFEISTGVSGSEAAVSDIAVEISLDGNQIYSGTVDTGEEISVAIDTRTIGGGSHTIEATASKTDYISAAETYTFTTPSLSLPDGGLGVQLQDGAGRAVFPQSIASLIGGLYGKSVAGNLQQLAKSVLFNRVSTPKYQEITVDLSTAQEGDIIQLLENGQFVDFYVAKLNYESGLNESRRTLLVRTTYAGNMDWNEANTNAYANSTVDTWLNGTYKSRFDSEMQAAMGTTEFYYTPGNGTESVTTLSRSVFLLSVTETGLTNANANTEGTALPIADTLREYSRPWFTRSPRLRRDDVIWRLSAQGQLQDVDVSGNYASAVRPAFTLPSTFSATYYVGPDGIHDQQEYTTGGSYTDLFGNNIPVPKVEAGTYVGTGAHGQGSPNKLTFSFVPKIVIVGGSVSGYTGHNQVSIFLANMSMADTLVGTSEYIIYLNWIGSSASWYAFNAEAQKNTAAITYYYLAIG